MQENNAKNYVQDTAAIKMEEAVTLKKKSIELMQKGLANIVIDTDDITDIQLIMDGDEEQRNADIAVENEIRDAENGSNFGDPDDNALGAAGSNIVPDENSAVTAGANNISDIVDGASGVDENIVPVGNAAMAADTNIDLFSGSMVFESNVIYL